jgi:mono/diheme cytochrome c family protein
MARRMLTLACAAVIVGSLGACGSQGDSVAKNSTYRTGAQLFVQHCAGCHTLDKVGTIGSATLVRDRERVDGPNFNVRDETIPNVLYAIRNGGFSGAYMPENIVVGQQAQQVAAFLAHYAGKKAVRPPSPPG